MALPIRYLCTLFVRCCLNELQIFSYNSNEVRTIQCNGEPWFVLKDVCQVLDLGSPHKVAERLDPDEKGVSQIDTLGGKQETTVINESGLYNVILRSDKPEAKLVGLTEAPAPTKKQDKPEPPSESVRERPTLSEVPEPAAQAAPEPEPEPEAPAGDWEPGGGASVEEPIPGPALTLEEIRAAGVAAAKAHGKPAVQAILKDLGAPGMTALDPGQYREFMRKLGELNAAHRREVH